MMKNNLGILYFWLFSVLTSIILLGFMTKTVVNTIVGAQKTEKLQPLTEPSSIQSRENHQLDGSKTPFLSTPTPTLKPTSSVSNSDNSRSPMIKPQQNQEVYFAVTGLLYSDDNCNGIRDNNEGVVEESASVRLVDTDLNYTYATLNTGNGRFSYAGYLKEGSSLSLQPKVVSPPTYKSNPHYTYSSFQFSKDAVLHEFEIPQVPAMYVGSCFPE